MACFFFFMDQLDQHDFFSTFRFDKMLEGVERLKKLYDMTGQTKKLYEVRFS